VPAQVAENVRNDDLDEEQAQSTRRSADGPHGLTDDGKSHFGLRLFAPPFRPSDLMRGTSGAHDCPLIGWTEGLLKSRQCSLDEPRFEGNPCGVAVRIEFLGHSQRKVQHP
jgi:hypothetical protein